MRKDARVEGQELVLGDLAERGHGCWSVVDGEVEPIDSPFVNVSAVRL